ncbi:MAG: GNAT family N-acetyltransferase [Acholeplasmataceae bacterium]|jgi:ribosomal protein S18 acetylase RimI-like enzyme|nr:GNAT family N-acetyltransferase [Acholeplasmataceae bacterium]
MAKIEQLSELEYRDFKLDYEYVTKAYYYVAVKKKKDVKIIIKKKKLMRKLEKKFTDFLFQKYIEQPQVYGIFDRKKLVAVIEGSIETWNNRYRIWNFLVDKKYRRNGYGKQLFQHIIEVAKEQKARALVLECQSCNAPAISFYLDRGMHFIGLDTMSYTNNDIDNKEVRLEMGMRL